MPPNPMEDEEDEEESEPESSDNEEIQSQPNGRINATSQPVTVASAPYQGQQQQQHYHHQALTLALPIQNSSRVPVATSGGREDCWSEGATAMLIDAWGERYLELSRGNLKQKHWKDVADIVSSRDDYTKPPKTDVQCKNRIDTVKKKYKIEKSKIAAGGGPSKWVFFNKLDRLIGGGPPRKLIPPNAPTPATPAIAIPPSKAIVTVPAQHQQQRAPQPGSSNSGGPDSSDSFPPVAINGKRRRAERESARARARARASNSVRDLTRAVLEFGEVYERVERSKLQQVMEMEQQRMVFAKELELQRMQFFMKTQLELAQMKHGRTGIGNNSNNTG